MHSDNRGLETAKTYLDVLGGRDQAFDWRILPKEGAAILLRGRVGEHFPALERHNRQGAGIFAVVNESDGRGQREENIIKVRALFADLDGCPLSNIDSFPLKPHIVIETSPGKYHTYWRVIGIPVPEFKSFQQRIANLCGSDPVVCDPPRVMRVPGLFHQKGAPFLTRILSQADHAPFTLQEVREALPEDSGPGKLSIAPHAAFDINKPLGDGERTQTLTHFCGKYIAMALGDEEIMAILRPWNQRNMPPLPDLKLIETLASIRRCDNRNQPIPQLITDLNKDYAVATLGGKTVVVREHGDNIDFMSFTSFREYHSNLPLEDKQSAAQFWLTHPNRRSYAGVVFDPAEKAANSDYYNLWKGLAVKPEEGDCSTFLNHIRNNICSGDEALDSYVLDWMADAVQNTGTLPGVALVLRGDQGTGKGVFATYFGALFGTHFKHVQTANHLTGQFTKHLADVVVIFADEVVWGGDKQREGILKTLITESTRLLEAKGKDAITVSNYARIIMATNESWAVPASIEERRYCVIEVGNQRRQDSDYFSAISKEMDSGGLAALLDVLLKRDISDVNIRKFPKTNALLRQKEQTLDSVPRWWLDRLKLGSIERYESAWAEWMSTEELFLKYSEATAQEKFVRGRVYSPSEFITQLKKFVPISAKRKSQTNSERAVVNGRPVTARPRGYDLPTLEESRSYFEKVLSHSIEWDMDDV